MGQCEGKSIYERDVKKKNKNDLEIMNKELTAIIGIPPKAPGHRYWEVDGERPRILIRGHCGGLLEKRYKEAIHAMQTQTLMSDHDMEFDPNYHIFIYALPKYDWELFLLKWEKYNIAPPSLEEEEEEEEVSSSPTTTTRRFGFSFSVMQLVNCFWFPLGDATDDGGGGDS